jgi:hypothetical protein
MKPYVYDARVGEVGQVAFYKEPKTLTYCFYFYNGKEYTPLYLSEEAAYYVWAFIGCEHPEATATLKAGIAVSKAPKKNFTSTKKAGRGKPKKKRPSLTKKKKSK